MTLEKQPCYNECRLHEMTRQVLAALEEEEHLLIHNILRDKTLVSEAYKEFLEKIPFPIIIIRRKDSTLRYRNQRAIVLFEFTGEEGIGLHTCEFYAEESERQALLKKLQSEGSVYDMEFSLHTYKKRPFWAFISASLIEYEGEEAILISINDITAQKLAEMELKANEEKYRLLAENTGDVIWVMNMSTMKYVYISPSIQQLRGFTVEEAMAEHFIDSMTPESAKYLLDHEEKTHSMEAFLADPEHPKLQIHEIQQSCKNGEIIWVETSTKFRLNAQMEIETVGTSRNIDARKHIEQEILYLSYRDQLTGLYNRRFIEEEIRRTDTERNLPISIILGDIDKLKQVNDSFGHDKGDEFIVKAANAIKTSCRPDDLVSRWGGDEFVILLPKTSHLDAEKVVERIYNKCITAQVNDIYVNISIGIGTKVSAEESINDIIRQADDDMYQVKANKRKG